MEKGYKESSFELSNQPFFRKIKIFFLPFRPFSNLFWENPRLKSASENSLFITLSLGNRVVFSKRGTIISEKASKVIFFGFFSIRYQNFPVLGILIFDVSGYSWKKVKKSRKKSSLFMKFQLFHQMWPFSRTKFELFKKKTSLSHFLTFWPFLEFKSLDILDKRAFLKLSKTSN